MELKIEGKLKEGFFEWCWETHYKERMSYSLFLTRWTGLPQSAQFGLLQEYADTLGHLVLIEPNYTDIRKMYLFRPTIFYGNDCWDSIMVYDSRPESQVAAIDKLNEIVNN